jgi:type I restriction enzyme S subunit
MGNQVLDEKILKIDKSKWKLTKLGTLAEDISVRVDKPGNSEYDRFVGLDNFVSGDIKIKTWASTKNLTSSAKAFKAGDILFARRNAYLRRASLVDFDGCCSGDAFVIRENADKVVPGFLAFLMNTNALWDYANSNAAGTMSKRVKWHDLAEYEFLLPPKHEQTKLAELLWSIDILKNKYTSIETKTKTIKNIYLLRSLNGELRFKPYLNKGFIKTKNGLISNDWKISRLGDIAKVRGGRRLPNGYKLLKENTGYPYIKAGDLKNGTVTLESLEYISKEVQKSVSNYIINHSDTYITIVGAYIGDVGVIPLSLDGANLTENAAKISSQELNNRYLAYFLSSPIGKEQIKTSIGIGAQPKLALSRIENFSIPVPKLEEQELIVEHFGKVEACLENIKANIIRCSDLQKSLINQIF